MSPVSMAWIFLVASILTEVLGMIALKYSKGFTLLAPTAMAVVSILASLWLIALSLKHLELGVTYAIWASCSTAIIALIGVMFYAETLPLIKAIGLAFVVAGVVLLNLGTK